MGGGGSKTQNSISGSNAAPNVVNTGPIKIDQNKLDALRQSLFKNTALQ